ncbi:hypothetical_protein [Leishmania braziliensis MHOM/BR/75/M2904]|uniref:Hypothetical_protein n=1 Tax=Leishmania braziliensis MHOM/BR/75/M2904 TaxID=420245 RepID=A0A3P3ZDL8_LEIBR|nr:hypothetical_protein [Leishmania braziliensis MHOM/BR/75/M2904]
MLSDTESLAFVEEEDGSPPLPRGLAKAPAPALAPQRIKAMPHLESHNRPPGKAASAKPPLHSSTSGAAAGASVVHPPHSVAARNPAKFNITPDFSDSESISFAMDDDSIAGVPMPSGTSSMPPPLPGTRLSLTNATPTRLSKRLSRASSIRSIQFNSEPGSRVTSPNSKARLKLFNSAPVEKAEEPTQPASDSSITFFEQGAESTEFGFSLPGQSGTMRHTVGAGDRNSVGTEDSLAFQIEDDSNLMQNHSIPVRRDGRSAAVAESGGGDLGDNESISFMVDDDVDDEDQQEQGTLSRPAKRDIEKPNASPLQRSHLAHGCPSPRLPNAGIRADTANTRNESTVDLTDALPCDGGKQAPVAHKRSASRSLTPTSSLIPDGLTRSPNAALEKTAGIDGLDTAGEAGMAAVPSSASSRLTKKAIVMKRLQQQKHHSRLPQPRKGAATHVLGDAERLPLRRATHPPLYQPAAVSTPLDAQAVEAPSVSLAGGSKKDRSTSLSSRSSSRGKGAQALLLLHPPHPERQHHQICRSKESVTSQATGESPNQQLVTEKGSNGSTDPPPTPLLTGHRSPTSREVASAAASGLQSSKVAFPPPPGQGPQKTFFRDISPTKR